jgi:hypothetical protein
MLASGCTGTDVLDSGHQLVTIEVVLEGATTQSWDCINMTFNEISVRPLDGQCSAESDIPGQPCLSVSDCPNGTCLGSEAAQIIPETGIVLLAGATNNFNFSGTACVPVLGVCSLSAQPCSTLEPGSCDPGESCVTASVAAPAFQIPGTSLPDGLYELSDLFLGRAILYNTATGTLAGGCDSNPTDITAPEYLGKPLFTFDAAHPNVIRLVVNLPALENALAPGDPASCAFFDNLTSILSIE